LANPNLQWRCLIYTVMVWDFCRDKKLNRCFSAITTGTEALSN